MSDNYEFGVQQISVLNSKLSKANFDYEKEISLAIKNCPSMLDAYDYVFAIIIGILGAVIDTNEKLETFLDQIHQAANSSTKTGNDFSDLLAKLLHHQGDWIDKVPTADTTKAGTPLKKYVSRASEQSKDGVWEGVAGGGPHRIFWGHDIFSFHEDNPLFLSIKQYSLSKGVLQAIRHLVADTCSKQGLPIPGSSWSDYGGENEDGKPSKNHLLDFCQEYSKEILCKKQTGVNNDVFNHMFSIHMQDVLSSGLVSASIKGYCKARNIIDDDRIIQMRIIAYGFNFFGAAIIGASTHEGIPYINWPCFAALTKNIIQMIHVTDKDIKKLACKTELLILERMNVEEYAQKVRTGLLYSFHGDLVGGSPNEGRDSLIKYLGRE